MSKDTPENIFAFHVYNYLCGTVKCLFHLKIVPCLHVPIPPTFYSPLSRSLRPQRAMSRLSLMSPYETIKNRCYCCIITKLANTINWRRAGNARAGHLVIGKYDSR